MPSCQTWQSKAKPAQHSNFQRRQALCHSQLWKTTPGTMPLSTMENNARLYATMKSSARHYATINYGKQRQALCHYGKQCTVVDDWERCTVDERTTVIQFRRRGARRVSGAYRCTFTSSVTCIWAIYPACTSRAVSGCYRNVAKAQCRVRQ